MPLSIDPRRLLRVFLPSEEFVADERFLWVVGLLVAVVVVLDNILDDFIPDVGPLIVEGTPYLLVADVDCVAPTVVMGAKAGGVDEE